MLRIFSYLFKARIATSSSEDEADVLGVRRSSKKRRMKSGVGKHKLRRIKSLSDSAESSDVDMTGSGGGKDDDSVTKIPCNHYANAPYDYALATRDPITVNIYIRKHRSWRVEYCHLPDCLFSSWCHSIPNIPILIDRLSASVLFFIFMTPILINKWQCHCVCILLSHGLRYVSTWSSHSRLRIWILFTWTGYPRTVNCICVTIWALFAI